LATANTITFSGESFEKVFGSSECNANTAIKLDWTFASTVGLIPATPIKFTVFLGDNAQTDTRVELFSIDREQTAAANGATGVTASSGISSTVTDINKVGSKGMYTGTQYLTIRDLIGYYTVITEQGQAPAKSEDTCQLKAASDSTGVIRTKICVVAEFQPSDTNQTDKDTVACHDIQIDLTPPTPPSNISVSPSETQIKVSWTTKTNYTYDVYISKQEFTKDNASTVVSEPHNGANAIAASSYDIKNLDQSTKYYISVRARDAAGNQGDFSTVTATSTVELMDFYEAYRKAGGQDKGFAGGGYCFIATAAYGTYDHRYVKILRDFRDKMLLTNGPGRSFVRWYYANSPKWADWIRKHHTARRAVQVMLFPLIATAAFFVRLSLVAQVLFLLGLLCLLLGWRLRKRWLQMAPLVFCLFAMPAPAQAESPRNFSMEARAGIYQPQIDQESGLSQGQTPYKTTFGDPLQLYLELGFEWLVFKNFGSVGIGGSVGFTWAEAQAQSASGTVTGGTGDDNTTQNTNRTGLWIIPLRFDISYRFDYFVHSHKFPLVPYIRGGLDYYLWLVTNPAGSIASDTSTQENNSAFGGRFGFHFGLGVQFLLDILDRRSAKTFDIEVGVNHTYLFFEWNWSWVGLMTPGLNLSDSSFRAGLLFQF
jgi:hypothetical protein